MDRVIIRTFIDRYAGIGTHWYWRVSEYGPGDTPIYCGKCNSYELAEKAMRRCIKKNYPESVYRRYIKRNPESSCRWFYRDGD